MGVTVCLISYNQKDLISDSINSILNQSKKPDEVIICDDNSTDGTKDVILDYKSSYPELITTMLHEENKGIPANLNSGLRRVSTEYVTWVAGDDIIAPKKIEEEYKKITNEGSGDVVFSDYYYIDDNGDEIKRWSNSGTVPEGDVFKEVCADNWPDGNKFRNPLLPIEIVRELGYFDESFTMYSDWDFKIRLSHEHTMTYIPKPLTKYRIHKDSITTRSDPEVYISELKRLKNKNKKTMENNLQKNEYERSIKEINNIINLFKAKKHRENQNTPKSIKYYMKYISHEKSELMNWRNHIYYILPKNIYKTISNIKNNYLSNIHLLSRWRR